MSSQGALKRETPVGVPQRSVGERSEPERSGGTSTGAAGPLAPDPEVPARAARRRFTGEYKLRILEAAEACRTPGDIGALLRREGLYSSHLAAWRRQRRAGELKGLTPKSRGPQSKKSDPQQRKIHELEQENRRLRDRLQRAETILAIQKKASALLGIPLNNPESDEND